MPSNSPGHRRDHCPHKEVHCSVLGAAAWPGQLPPLQKLSGGQASVGLWRLKDSDSAIFFREGDDKPALQAFKLSRQHISGCQNLGSSGCHYPMAPATV